MGWRFCSNIESSRSLGHSAEDVLLSGAQQRALFWRCKLEAQQQTDRCWNHGQVSICFQLFQTCLVHLKYNRRGGCLGATWDDYFTAFPTLTHYLSHFGKKKYGSWLWLSASRTYRVTDLYTSKSKPETPSGFTLNSNKILVGGINLIYTFLFL